MAFIRYLVGIIGRFFRLVLKVKFKKSIYQSMGFYGPFSVNVNERKIILNNDRDGISNDIFYSGIFGNFEGLSLKIWNQLCLNAETSYVFDIGGYSGIYSLVAASASTKINIQTFEPHPGTFNLLMQNISSNTFKNINANNFALGDKDGKIKFYNAVGNHPSGFSSINHRFIEKNADIKICDVKNFSSLLNSTFSDLKISLIKIDIERAELPLLQSVIERILEDRACVLSEILDVEFYEEFDDLFFANNYQSIKIDDLNNSFKKVDRLLGGSKMGDNVLFLPSEFNFNIIEKSL